jgi:folate-binding protein YgfZ
MAAGHRKVKRAAADDRPDLAYASQKHIASLMTITHLEDRTVLRIAGAEARSFLQGLLTNDLDTLSPEVPLYAGLLSPQGKALFDMLLYAGDEGSVLVDVAADRAPALAKRLSMYRLRKAVTIEPTDLAVFAGWNGGEVGHTADPRFPGLGARWIGVGEGTAAREGTGNAGADAYDAHRLAIGVPGSADIGEDQLLWLETGADLLNGVSFTKGCYVGQENTARMHHRDKVRRRLVPVRLAGDPGDGSVRDAAGRAAGTLRSQRDGLGIVHLRLEAASGALMAGEAVLTVLRPDWIAPALLAAVAGE